MALGMSTESGYTRLQDRCSKQNAPLKDWDREPKFMFFMLRTRRFKTFLLYAHN